MSNIIIRNEQTGDYRQVEEIHRNAFWNLSVPGCNEHYLAHILRTHEDFVPELDYVCELDGQVVANVMYTKSKLADEQGNITGILTFGPIGVSPEMQHRGIGKALLEQNFFDGRKYYFYESRAFEINDSDAEAFDKTFEYREKAFQPSRRNFIFIAILSLDSFGNVTKKG